MYVRGVSMNNVHEILHIYRFFSYIFVNVVIHRIISSNEPVHMTKNSFFFTASHAIYYRSGDTNTNTLLTVITAITHTISRPFETLVASYFIF